MTDTDKIISRTKELAQLLDYDYEDLAYLIDAMDVTKIGDTNEPEYNNSALAVVGDAVLRLVLSETLYEDNYSRGEISRRRSALENNEALHNLAEKYQLQKYAYNESYYFEDAPLEGKLPNGKHDLYVEAIIGAVFRDLGYEECRKWMERKIIPELR